jgi:putative ABC transport system substrate-binding protein
LADSIRSAASIAVDLSNNDPTIRSFRETFPPVSLALEEFLSNEPGGNITGVVNQLGTINEKYLELLKEISPGIERVGIIHSPNNVASLASFKVGKEQTAPRLGLVVVPIPVSKPGDLDEAFATIVREGGQGLAVHSSPAIAAQRGRIAAFAIERRLPTTSGLSFMARDGLLMSYGFDGRVAWRRAASHVDRIFKGANPAELPVEQLDRFQLIINMTTARAMGLDLPPALVARADELIE